MVRRSLFLGLTAMLALVLVYLVVQGRKKEKVEQQNPRPIEVIRESKPTLTRIIAPQDLEIMEATMELVRVDKVPPDAGRLDARHRILIRNNGTTVCRNLRLRLSYMNRGGRILDKRITQLEEIVQPGQARTMSEFVIENIPAGTVKSSATILSAEVATSSSSNYTDGHK